MDTVFVITLPREGSAVVEYVLMSSSGKGQPTQVFLSKTLATAVSNIFAKQSGSIRAALLEELRKQPFMSTLTEVKFDRYRATLEDHGMPGLRVFAFCIGIVEYYVGRDNKGNLTPVVTHVSDLKNMTGDSGYK